MRRGVVKCGLVRRGVVRRDVVKCGLKGALTIEVRVWTVDGLERRDVEGSSFDCWRR